MSYCLIYSLIFSFLLCSNTTISQSVRTFIWPTETFSKLGLGRKCVHTNECVGQRSLHLVYLVKLYSSPTQNSRVSFWHTAAGSERDSAVFRSKHSYLYSSIHVNTKTAYYHVSHMWVFHFRWNYCDIFVLTRYSVHTCNHTCMYLHCGLTFSRVVAVLFPVFPH